jgi:hypothetical protein
MVTKFWVTQLNALTRRVTINSTFLPTPIVVGLEHGGKNTAPWEPLEQLARYDVISDV